MSDDQSNRTQDPTAVAMLRISDSFRAQTEAFVGAMNANTQEIKRLADKVDSVHTRVIRLEEQRHGKDIEAIRSDMEKINAKIEAQGGKITDIEMRHAQFLGAGRFMDYARQFLPWFVLIAAGVAVVLGFERTGM